MARWLRLVTTATFLFVFVSFLTAGAQAASGELLWQDRFDLGGGVNSANAVAVKGSRVFVAGFGTAVRPAMAPVDVWIVRAYNKKSGVLLWDDQFDNGGGASEARTVVVRKKRVFVAGLGRNAENDFQWVVRTYNAKTGEVLWQDQFDNGGGANDALAMAVKGSRLFVAGVGNTSEGLFEWIVRAYDAKTGDLLWDDRFALSGGGRAFSITVKGARLFVGGRGNVFRASGEIVTHWVVRAYNARTGELLWDDQFDAGGSRGDALAVSAKKSRVFFGGFSRTAEDEFEWIVRAYHSKKGDLLWGDQFDAGGGDNQVNTTGKKGSRLVAGGFGFTVEQTDEWVVRVYKTKNGELLWEDQFDNGGGNSEANDVAARGSRVFAGGFGANSEGGFDWIVRAHKAKNGALVWEDQFDNGGGDSEVEALETRGSRVFAVGFGETGENAREWVVRVYKR